MTADRRRLPQRTALRWVSALLLLSGPAIAEPSVTVIDHGDPSNRLDIAVMGDGYTAAQLDQFGADLNNFLQAALTEPPYAQYASYINVHRIDVTSNESGADHPENDPQVFVDTALDATYNCAGIERLICVDTSAVLDVLANSLAPDQRDIAIVLVNDAKYGGSGGAVVVSSVHSSGVYIVLHETGHSFGLLADEYAGGGPSCNPDVEPSEPNATRETLRAQIKWNHWIEPTTPIPTTDTSNGVPGLYEGAKYCDAGLYRPTYESMMRTLGAPFEQVNSEQLVKRIYNWVSPIDAASPASSSVAMTTADQQAFDVSPLEPVGHSLEVAWTLDSTVVATGTSHYDLDGSTLSEGDHALEVEVRDPTPLVRNDPASALIDSRSWTVAVPEPGRLPQLTAGGLLLWALGSRRRSPRI